mmetsp:Transcript_29617/g.36744  ORF Transcript_29617/g.36744 Transcript_29617/m.36744 type:complete len:80 (+) Transcript_29617:520-759(+)
MMLNVKTTENLSGPLGIPQPMSTNSNKLSAHTNIGMTNKTKGLIFEERKTLSQASHGEGHRAKRSLPDYSDILQSKLGS